MKRQHILHRTVYRYQEPVEFGMHRLVLRPREGHSLTVIRQKLTVNPSARLFWMNDIFGNNVVLAQIVEPSTSLEIESDVVVERVVMAEDAAPQRVTRISESKLPVAYQQLEAPLVQAYLTLVYPNEGGTILAWLEKTGIDKVGQAMDAVEQVGRAIYKSIRYLRREEAGVQTPAQTLQLGTGSCRDMAVLMLEACRHLGLAARFSSGYLDSAASAAGRGATHAWVDVYLPDSGWTGYDPSIGESVSHKHIAIGVSSHPRGVMPISGIFNGPPGVYLGMKVEISIRAVEPVQVISAQLSS